MRSRWLSELSPAGLGAVTEGAWAGSLAALVTGGSGAAWIAGAAGGTFIGAVLAAHSGAQREPGRRERAAAAGLTLVIAAAFFAAGRGWEGDLPVVAALGALAFAALLVYLGISLGRERISADNAVRRAVRAFALLCCVLAVAALAGSHAGWAGGAVVASLVAGALSVAAARAQSLSLTAHEDRATTWHWLLAVLGVVLGVVAAGALLSLVLRVDVLLWILAVAGEVLQYLLGLLGFVLGWAGAGLVRALSWVLGSLHLHDLPRVDPPQGDDPHLQALPKAPRGGAYAWTRAALTIAVAVVAAAAPLLIVAFALRRVRGSTPVEVEEEREAVLTLRDVSAGAVAGVRRRLARLVPRRNPPATPAQLVRREYEGLERRLSRVGHPRPVGTTVRSYLLQVADLQHGPPRRVDEPAGSGGGAPSAGLGASGSPVVELAGLYELARYSPHPVDTETADRFRQLSRAFAAPRSPAAE